MGFASKARDIWNNGVFGGAKPQSSKKASYKMDPSYYIPRETEAQRAPTPRAINLPQSDRGPMYQPGPAPYQANSGWIEDERPDFTQSDLAPTGVAEKQGWTINPYGAIRNVWDDREAPTISPPHSEDPLNPALAQRLADERLGYVREPRRLPPGFGGIVPPGPQGAMGMIGGYGTQRHIADLFDTELAQYAATRNQQWRDAQAARQRTGWNGFIKNVLAPATGLFGVDPATATQGLDAQMERDQKAMLPYQPTDLLKDAKLFADLASSTDPESYKNMLQKQKMETEAARAGNLLGKTENERNIAGAKVSHYEQLDELIKNKQKWGDAKMNREDLNGQVMRAYRNKQIDSLEADMLLKQIESEAKVERTKADTDRITASAAKIRADIENNAQKVANENAKLDDEIKLLKARASKINSDIERHNIELEIRKKTAEINNNAKKFQTLINAHKAEFQVGEDGKAKFPGMDKYAAEVDKWVRSTEPKPEPAAPVTKPQAKPAPRAVAPQAKPQKVAAPAAKAGGMTAEQREWLKKQLRG